MKRFNAYAMQIMNYDSPLISIKADNDMKDIIILVIPEFSQSIKA